MFDDELPPGEVEHAVLHEVARPVLAPWAVGRVEVEGRGVLVGRNLMGCFAH